MILRRLRKFFFRRRLRRKIKAGRRLLRSIDRAMAELGASRADRKRIWRDFQKSDDHSEIIDVLEEVSK